MKVVYVFISRLMNGLGNDRAPTFLSY